MVVLAAEFGALGIGFAFLKQTKLLVVFDYGIISLMPTLKKLFDIPEPEMGAPQPFVLASEYSLSICYHQAKASFYQGEIVTDDAIKGKPDLVSILRFKYPQIFKFGNPNEDEQPLHPLAEIGLMDFYAFEVEESNWANRSLAGEYINKHFIILFHDSTFEIVADSYSMRSIETEFILDACQDVIDNWPDE